MSHVTACAASWVIYVRDANIRPAPARENRDEGMCAIQEMDGDRRDPAKWGGGRPLWAATAARPHDPGVVI